MKYNFTILLFLFFKILVIGQDYHVQPNGNDENSGTIDNPWKTIQNAMEKATPGSIVYIHAGVYMEFLHLEVSGNEGAPIVFKAFESDEVFIDGANADGQALLQIIDQHHVSIESLIFQNFQEKDAVGIWIEGASNHIQIKNCIITEINFSEDEDANVSESTNAQPLIVYGTDSDYAITDLEISGNTIYNCRTGFSEALAINGNVNGFIVSDNTISDISNIGIDIIGHEGTCQDASKDQARNGKVKNNEVFNCQSPYATAAGIYVDGGKDIIIENNVVHHNQWGIEVGCENIGKSAENIVVRNNFIYYNISSGIHVGGYDYPSGSGKVRFTQVVNNSFYGNDMEDENSGEIYLSYNESLRIYNNIFVATNGQGVLLSSEDLNAESSGIEFQNNNWLAKDLPWYGAFHYKGKGYETIIDFKNDVPEFINNVSDIPGFVMVGDEINLHLKSNSPMIDAGLSGNGLNYGFNDIDGGDRIQDDGIDIGADEFGVGSVNVNETYMEKEKLVLFPNPVENLLFINTEGLRELITDYEIYDIIGKLVAQNSLDGNAISLNNIESGYYFVRLLRHQEILYSSRIIKK